MQRPSSEAAPLSWWGVPANDEFVLEVGLAAPAALHISIEFQDTPDRVLNHNRRFRHQIWGMSDSINPDTT